MGVDSHRPQAAGQETWPSVRRDVDQGDGDDNDDSSVQAKVDGATQKGGDGDSQGDISVDASTSLAINISAEAVSALGGATGCSRRRGAGKDQEETPPGGLSGTLNGGVTTAGQETGPDEDEVD